MSWNKHKYVLKLVVLAEEESPQERTWDPGRSGKFVHSGFFVFFSLIKHYNCYVRGGCRHKVLNARGPITVPHVYILFQGFIFSSNKIPSIISVRVS